jgi:hypothetical protein
VAPGVGIDIEFYDGHVGAVAAGEREGRDTTPKPKTRRGGGEGQGRLF